MNKWLKSVHFVPFAEQTCGILQNSNWVFKEEGRGGKGGLGGGGWVGLGGSVSPATGKALFLGGF